jgi:LmbE family N-acetylglucosaminyl deacetylase
VKENTKKLFEKSLKIVKSVGPDQILSFGPEGISAHWDHIATGKAALKIAKKLKVPLAAFTLSGDAIARQRKDFFLSRRKFGKYAGIPEHRKGDVKIKVDVAVKRKAMSNHRSQFGNAGPFSELPKRVRDEIFGYEHFVEEKI